MTCQGAQDHEGNAMCDGSDVREVMAVPALDPDRPFKAIWCSECRMMARSFGTKTYVLEENQS